MSSSEKGASQKNTSPATYSHTGQSVTTLRLRHLALSPEAEKGGHEGASAEKKSQENSTKDESPRIVRLNQ